MTKAPAKKAAAKKSVAKTAPTKKVAAAKKALTKKPAAKKTLPPKPMFKDEGGGKPKDDVAERSAPTPKDDAAERPAPKKSNKRDILGSAASTPRRQTNFSEDEQLEREFGVRFRELLAEKAEVAEDLRELRMEAKEAGVDYRVIERAIKLTEKSQAEIDEMDRAEAHAARLSRIFSKEWIAENVKE